MAIEPPASHRMLKAFLTPLRPFALAAAAAMTGCGAGSNETTALADASASSTSGGDGATASGSGGAVSTTTGAGSSASTSAGMGGAVASSAASGEGPSTSSGAGGGASTSTAGEGPSTSSGAGGGTSTSSSSVGGGASTSSGAGGGTSTSSSSVGGGTSTSTGPGGCQSNAECTDGIFCTGVEACVAGVCVPGAPPSCDDGTSCTTDFCDLASDGCKHVPDDLACSDGLHCNGAEHCDPLIGAALTGCAPGTPVACDDGLGCTLDTCSEAAAACVHTPSNALCDDGVFCDGLELCSPLVGCLAGDAIVCDDGLTCTLDACNEALAQCVFVPVDAACNDGIFCDGVETCDPAGPAPSGCKAGVPVPCASDGIVCTVDACSEATHGCAHVVDGTLCPPGQSCVLQQGGCTPFQPCSTSAQCQNGDLCDGVEACVNGVCHPGTPVDCDDGVGCTLDSCNPASGACSHPPSDAACGDGIACDGIETCNPQTGCVVGAPVACDDGVGCTVDQCLEPSGVCAHTLSNGLCSDGNSCNGFEQCTPSGCQPGAPIVCPDDGIACTTQVCDPVLNACTAVPHDNLCPCTQICKVGVGCGNFCQVKTCQGKVYQCGDCLDNDGDCKVDANDDQCLGPCDNTENSFYGGIPGQNNSPCKSDCYFDADTGAGNDDCYWSHKCDPLEVGPAFTPEGSQCAYSAGANIPGYNGSCAAAFSTQSAQCGSYCGPLTPNGCDCFGCCVIPGAPTPVWLGSESPPGTGSCSSATLSDATKCKPCTQVVACLNPCDTCEICVGKPTLPPGCTGPVCPPGIQACGPQIPLACPDNASCITGCCYANP